MSALAGVLIDRSYRLHESLGRGGMGTVYRATHLLSGKSVALKLISAGAHSADADASNMRLRLALVREFQTLAALHHPNVIRVLDYGFDDTHGSFFTMELLLKADSVLEAATNKSLADKIDFLAQLLRALVYVHQHEILHRDIKPSNVLVLNDEVKLLDFGIAAQMTASTELAGTLEYLAPELLLKQPPSTASDLYSVGVLAFQMLTGQFPFSRDSMTRMLDGILGVDSSDQTFSTAVAEVLRHYRLSDEYSATPDTDRQATQVEEFPDLAAKLQFPEEVPSKVAFLVRTLLAKRAEERLSDAYAALQSLAAAVQFPLPVETPSTRDSLLQSTELLGRESELARLKMLLQRTQTGQGTSVLIGGESGVGKSRLLLELRTFALVSGLWVIEGQSISEGGSYYQELLPLLRMLCFRTDMLDAEASILKPYLPEVSSLLERPVSDPAPATPQETQARLIATLLGLLAKVKKPLLILLEDLHWVHSETLTLLSTLTLKLAELPILLVGTFRSDERLDLPTQLPVMELMSLRRFGTSDIKRLSTLVLGAVGATPALISYLEQQTEGNVFFLIEVVRALAENAGELCRINDGELPESVLTLGIERIVERRLDRVNPAFRELLEFAATQGRKLDLLVLEQTFPNVQLRTFLFECANAAVLESQGTDFRFAHDKLRETLLRRIDAPVRKQLHLKVAEAIEATYADAERDRINTTLGHHFQQGGVFDKARDYYLQAGDVAAKLCLYEQARTSYAQALSMLEQLPDTAELPRQHVDILLKQALVGLYSEPGEVQLRRLAKARLLLEGLSQSDKVRPEDRLRMARLDYHCGRSLQLNGQPHAAIQHFQRVLPIAKEFAAEELMLVPAAAIGQALFAQGRFGKAREFLEPAVEPMLRQFGVSVEAVRCFGYYHNTLAGLGHCQQALAGMERLHKRVNLQDHPFFQGLFLVLHIPIFLLIGDWPTALQTANELYEFGMRTNETVYLYMSLDSMAWAQSYLGRFAEAIDNRARAVEVRSTKGGALAADWFNAAEAEILLNCGRTEDALRHAETVATTSEKAGLLLSQPTAERTWACALSRLGGEFTQVEYHFGKSLALCHSAEQVLNAAQTELWWGRICRERGDEAAAGSHFSRAIRSFETAGAKYALAEAQRIAKEEGFPN